MKIDKEHFNCLLKDKGIHKKELAKIFNLTLHGFNAKLRNHVRFSLDEIITISILLNMPVEKIFCNEYEQIKEELKSYL